MFRTLIQRELLNNILNLRFLIGLVLCLVATLACIMILAQDYRREMKDYEATRNLQDEVLGTEAAAKDFILAGRTPNTYKPPERFRLLILGLPGNEESQSFNYNPLPLLFPPLDFLFIVTIIMSLLALLFSYDAVAGERQSGTLKLVVANSISRTQILLAKVVGGTVSLLIPFVLALGIGVLYVAVHPAIQWDRSAWAELALLTAAAMTFITSFYLLGLMVSTLAKYPTIAILNCLFLWVLLILVIPNLCPYIAAEFCRIPSVREAERRLHEIQVQRENNDPRRKIEVQSIQAAREIMQAAAQKLKSQYGPLFSEFETMEYVGMGTWLLLGREAGPESPQAAEQRAAADPEFKAMMEACRKEYAKAMEEMTRIRKNPPKDTDLAKAAELAKEAERKAAILEDVHRKAALQTKLAKNLACISPYASFVYVARDLTGTGLRGLDYFAQAAKEYGAQLGSYRSKKHSEPEAKNSALKKAPSWDVSDRPRFVFREEPLKDKLRAVLPYWGILGLFNVVFFVAAFAGFMRYDVR
jgi:ABC-type transport system involved in multi-copper enzyme maturation permease subunit